MFYLHPALLHQGRVGVVLHLQVTLHGPGVFTGLLPLPGLFQQTLHTPETPNKHTSGDANTFTSFEVHVRVFFFKSQHQEADFIITYQRIQQETDSVSAPTVAIIHNIYHFQKVHFHSSWAAMNVEQIESKPGFSLSGLHRKFSNDHQITRRAGIMSTVFNHQEYLVLSLFLVLDLCLLRCLTFL